MLKVCFHKSEKDQEMRFCDELFFNKLNEDYIEKIDDRDEIDITQDDIETSVQNLINGTYDKLTDIDMSLLPDAYYQPADIDVFRSLLNACLDNIN